MLESTHHDREDTLLHLPGIFRTQDNHFHTLEVDLNRGSAAHTLGKAIGRELTRVVNDKVGFAKVCQLLFRRADEHVVLKDHLLKATKIWGNLTNHEESVIGTSANHPNFDTVFRVPLPLALEDIQHIRQGKNLPLQIHRKRKHCRACSNNR